MRSLATRATLSALIMVVATTAPPIRGAEVEGEIRFGLHYFLQDSFPGSAKFEEYREVPNGLTAERLLFSWTPRPSFFLEVDAYDVTQNDQRIRAALGDRDLWLVDIHWTENQRLWTDESATLFADQGEGIFTLENSFQQAVQAASSTNVDADADNVWDPNTKGNVVQLGVAEGAQDVFVGHQRSSGGMLFEITPSRLWTFSASAVRERRDGTTVQNLGMHFSQAPAEVAAPYDLKTDWLTGTAEYSNQRYNIGFQAMSSVFETSFTSLTWDNQLFLADTATANPLTANPGHGRTTLWTDSDWTRFAAYGGVNLPGRTRVDASVSRVETTQEDSMLPMTINSLLTPSPLPATFFDGEHVTTQGRIRVFSRPTRKFRWAAWGGIFDMSNESPQLTFNDYVTADYQIPVCGNVNVCDTNGNGNPADDTIARRSLPYGYERTNGGVLVGWSPTLWFDGALSYERENLQREFSAVEDSDEDIVKLALDFDVGDHWGLRTTLRHQERRADEYDAHYLEESFPVGEPNVAAFNEGTRRFYWTDRDRDAASLLIDWTPSESWSFYGEATYQDDEYFDPETGKALGDSFSIMEDRNFDGIPETYDILLAGRTDDKMTSWTAGTTYSHGQRITVSADYTFERWDYGLETRYRNVTAGVGTDDPLDNWGSDVQDDHETINLGLQATLTKDKKWSLLLDAARSEGTGKIETHFVPGGASSGNTTLTEFPELKTTLIIAMAALQHSLRPNLDYAIRYWFEDWDEDNFSADFNEPYMGAPNQDPSMAQALYLGIDFEDYTNHILSVILRYRY